MKRIFQEKVHSRWLILCIDQFILSWALCMSLLLIHRIDFIGLLDLSHLAYILLFHCIAIPVFILMEIHTGIIRYSNTKDMVRIFLAVLLSSILFTGISNLFIVPYLQLELSWLDTVLLLNFFISSSLLILLRIVVKGLFSYFKDLEGGEQKEKILIYGSDATAILLKQALEALQKNCCQVMGFIDDDADKVNKYIEQTKVYHSASIETLAHKYGIEKLVVSSDLLSLDSKKKTIEKSVELGLKVLTVPPSSQWLYGKLHFSQLKDLRIEDLLQREPILLQRQNIFREVLGKRILVTGAAGSIGSEIVRQLLNYQPEYVVLCDQAETPLHELQLEVEDLSLSHKVKIYMASIQNPERMQLLFEKYKPQIVFHAAACKHVPMMEDNPAEAILTNVGGTKNLADISIAFGVEKFVMISTDKAVKPTNIMGASKRLAEIYIQSLNEKRSSPRFITTRFGNVMGSNGSVIPRFKTQIERGGPLTVTHPDITRYFMTISESVQLVLEAAAMGNGGEIFIFDMGKPIRIVDLALKMIQLAGLSPIRDIKIVYSGLRPGEKLHEELLHQEEQTIPTHHQKIKISRTISYSCPYVQTVIAEVLRLNQLNDNYATVRKMKEIIPEFRSNNSIYEDLDHLLFE